MDFPLERFGQTTGLDIEDTGEDVLLYRDDEETSFYLNGTAALVWRLCDGQRTGADIEELLAAAYPDEPAVATDVHLALAELLERGLIERH
jgi:pyrroloquinoline quinone biosynthesis protein D